MRLIILVALCFAVAAASYGNTNRLQRQQQRQQRGEQAYANQNQFNDEYDSDEKDEDNDNIYQQQQQQQCQQGGPNCGQDEDDQEEQWQYGPTGQQQQGRRQQQQHQCQPRFQLLQALEPANCQLAAKLYQQAQQETDDKNTVVSPVALQQALAALQQGARGNTRRQLQNIVGGGLNQQQTQQAHAALQQCLRGQGQCQQQTGQQQTQIKTTTTIVLNQQTHTQQQFIQQVRSCQNVQVKKCNFQRQPQQCRQQINRYLAQKTNQKCQQTVPQCASTSNTKLLVVNTAQLRANWGRQFRQQQRTKQGVFFPLGQQQPRRVQTLQSQGQFNYYEDEQLQVVGVPTQQQELTFYVLVPKTRHGLTQVEKRQIQNGQQLQQILEQADQQQQNVQIELPQFQINHKLDAKQTLCRQGARSAFDADLADFSGITGQQTNQYGRQQQQYSQDDQDQDQDQQQNQNQQVHVNKLIHQVTIQVNEQGIRAASPTGQQQGQQGQQNQQNQQWQQQDNEEDEQEGQYWQQQWNRQQQYQNIFGQTQNQRQRQQQYGQQYGQQQNSEYGQGRVVRANHAFAFAIKHNPSNQIVMIGRVVDATQQPTHQGQQCGQDQTLGGIDQQ